MEIVSEQSERVLPQQSYERLQAGRDTLLGQLRRVIVGQDQVIEELMIVLFAGGHCLITGAPGLAKTLLVRSIAHILDLTFKRIQFTPDLMPSDIVGSEILEEDRGSGRREFKFVPGPVFTNVLLADEINRTPPKTQSALLEAMEEKQVTVAGERRPLAWPFFVLATQNPIELEGTYPLPEAQLDRFMFNILIDYLNEDEELLVATQTTSDDRKELETVFSGQDMLDFARLTRQVPVAQPVARYAVRLTQASRPGNGAAPEFITKWVSWGAGTRGTQSLLLGAKARALLKGRFHVSCADIRAVASPALRHRILTNFRAEADRVGVEDIIAQLLEAIPEPKSGLE
jgi:MoxR-like ATPase